MRLLLDTNVVVWLYAAPRSLGPDVVDALASASDVFVSVIAFVEFGIKAATGKLSIPPRLEDRIVRDGIGVLPIKPAHGLALADLPLHHRDPFDRLLIAQACADDLVILTSDAAFEAYDVRTLDPRR